jgi:rubrerythrin
MTDPLQCSLDMLAAALEMEEKGKAFYEKAAETCRDPLGREVFLSLIQDEIVHSRRIQRLHDSLTSGKCWTREWESLEKPPQDLGALFQELAVKEKEKIKPETSDIEAIDIALDFELASISFYNDHMARSGDPLEKDFLNQMVLEERDHYRALKDTRYYLTDPEGWFIEKERAGLEGRE